MSGADVAAMLPMVLEFLEEHGFKKTAAVFKEESKVEKRLKLVELFQDALKRKRGEAVPSNGAAKPAAAKDDDDSDDDDDDDDE